MKLLLAMTGVVVLGSVAAVLVVPPSARERQMQRQVEAERLIDHVSAGVWRYHREQGVFPPGNGTGTARLVVALSKPSRSGVPYVRFRAEGLTGQGHLRNPIAPEIEIVSYRNNRESGGEFIGARNLGAFDLWCRDVRGWTDGVNNWSRSVPSP